jgi:hypothetical protein
MTFAYRKGALSEEGPLSRRSDSVPQAAVPLFWDGGVMLQSDLRQKFEPLLDDAHLKLLRLNALQLSPDLVDFNREGYSQDSFYGDEGEWTKDSRIEAKEGYFWLLDRLGVPRNSQLRLRLIA